ncbi:MAG: hypothetical protein IK020_05505 [Clostridiales bacterium]|nr:hypothetical protein [Clostridiales bacterium]
MKKVRALRTICVIALALILLFVSLDLLLPRRNDAKSGRAAVCFIHEGLLFPQTDISQLFSHLDIASYYVVEDGLTQEEMAAEVSRVLAKKRIDSVILVCEGDYALSGLSIASGNGGVTTGNAGGAAENSGITDLILLSPELPSAAELDAAAKNASAANADESKTGSTAKSESTAKTASTAKTGAAVFSELGAKTPSCRVAIFSEKGTDSDTIYERLSGEDTKLARGVKADESAPELYLSSDAMRYYARMGNYPNPEVASVITMNSPVMQTYLANYLKNHTLGEKGISRAPLWTWVAKTVCTILTLIAFFLYASTLPANRRFKPEETPKEPGEKEHERDRKGKLRGRSIAEKYKSTLNHLLALQLLLGAVISLPALVFVARKDSAYRVVLLVWVCFSFLSSAFFLMPYIRKLKGRKVRSSRSMWPLHLLFTVFLAGDIFMLTLLWKGSGFLKLDLLLLIAIVLSVLVGIAMAMLRLTDNFFGKIQGSNQSVLDSVKFSAIRFVPLVIVFTFSIIIGRGLYAVQVFLLAASLLGASYLRRVVRKGALGEVLSVILYAALYWMMF